MKKYIVRVDLKQSHIYEVEANSESEAYEKMDGAYFHNVLEPVDLHTEEPIPGVEYGECEIFEHEVWTHITKVE